MKKTMEKEVTICDECGKESYLYACLACGVEHCYDCQDKLGVEYGHALHFSGSRNGYFCLKCDAELPQDAPTRVHQLHKAYKTIQNLRRENEAWYKDFEERSEKAETYLKSLSK